MREHSPICGQERTASSARGIVESLFCEVATGRRAISIQREDVRCSCGGGGAHATKQGKTPKLELGMRGVAKLVG